MNNTVSYNFAMRHNTATNSIQVDPSVLPSQSTFASAAPMKYSNINSAEMSINTDPAELRQQIDFESDILMQFDATSSNGDYDLDNLISFIDSGAFDYNLPHSDISNNDFS